MKKKDRPKATITIMFWIAWHTGRLLPLPLAARLLGSFMHRFADRFTRQPVIRENLAKAFPDMTPQKVKQTARNVAANLGVITAEMSHMEEFRCGIAKGRLTFSGGDHLLLAKTRPVVFVGTHQWNWEMIPLFHIENGVDLTVIYANLGNDLLDRMMFMARSKTGAIYVERQSAVRAAIDHLDRGRSLALLMDQRVKSGAEVTFFGRPSLMTSFPARLSLRFGCPIVPVDLERRDGHRFHLEFRPPIYPPAGAKADAERQITQAIAEEFERIISRSPDTWFCNKPRWPEPAQSLARST